MKKILIVFITVLFLPYIESNNYNLQIKEILTKEVCSNGILILDAELNIPIKDKATLEKPLKVFLRNSNEDQGYTSCFLLHFEGKTSAKVGCDIIDFSQALYQLTPLTSTVNYKLYGHTLNLLAYSVKTPFQITSGSELYYYTTVYEIKLNFTKADEKKNLEFYLSSETSSKTQTVYLDDIKIECTVKNGNKLLCPITAKNVIQENNHKYQVYLIDSNKNKKINYLVNPIEVTLQYNK